MTQAWNSESGRLLNDLILIPNPEAVSRMDMTKRCFDAVKLYRDLIPALKRLFDDLDSSSHQPSRSRTVDILVRQLIRL
jgi:hypothetical protein